MLRASSAFAVVALALAGCTAPIVLPERAPRGTGDDQVRAIFERDRSGFRTISADVEGDSEKGSFSGKVFVDREGRRFRLLAWKLGGAISIFDLLVRDEEMRLLVPRARKVVVRSIADAPAPATPTAGAFPIGAFLGTLLRPPEPRILRVVDDGRGIVRLLELTDDPPRPLAIHELAPGSLALLGQTLHPSTPAELQISYGDHVVLPDGRIWPTSMSVRRPGEPDEKAFSLHFENIVFDRPLDARKFEMRLPPGTEQVKDFAELDRD